MADDVPLDVIGAVEGTDKSSAIHDYLRHYEALFLPFRDAAIAVIEIGVLNGASLRMWEQFFSRAELIGVDINPDARRHLSERVRIEIGSQADKQFLAMLCEKYRPTIVIDDGSHMADHVIATFEAVFPSLQPGGLYVAEDLYFHLTEQAPQFRGQAIFRPPAYFKAIATGLMRRRTDPVDQIRIDPALLREIDSITFAGGMAALRKKAPLAEREHLLAEAERLAARHGSGTAWYGAAGFLHRQGATERAVAAARRAVALAPGTADHQRRLGTLLSHTGDPEGARAALIRATELTPNDPWVWNDLGFFEERQGRHELAGQHYRCAMALEPGNPIFPASLARVQPG